MIKIRGCHVDASRIEYISEVYFGYYSNQIKFFVLLQNRKDEISFMWDTGEYIGETKDSVYAKICIIRDKLVEHAYPYKIINLDGIIDLKKQDTEEIEENIMTLKKARK